MYHIDNPKSNKMKNIINVITKKKPAKKDIMSQPLVFDSSNSLNATNQMLMAQANNNVIQQYLTLPQQTALQLQNVKSPYNTNPMYFNIPTHVATNNLMKGNNMAVDNRLQSALYMNIPQNSQTLNYANVGKSSNQKYSQQMDVTNFMNQGGVNMLK